jgi:NAD(P)-dependent dehydrogenase (short-subunit alcohol dehydrogenase family)
MAAVGVEPPISVVGFLQPLTEMTDADWDHVIAINLPGVYACTKTVVKAVLAYRLPEGGVINIGRVWGRRETRS